MANITGWTLKLNQYTEACARAAQAAIESQAEQAVADMKAATVAAGKVDRGTLRDGWTITRFQNQYAFGVRIGGAAHAIFAEDGRRAGARMPPLDVIRDWVQRHGMPASAAYPVARAIAERGIQPTPIVEPALAELRPKVLAALKAAVAIDAFRR
jgi:hypothetical protein